MARLLRDRVLRLLAGLALLGLAPAVAEEATPGLFEQPALVLETGMHMAPIRAADMDAAGRIAVTASDDKTLRVWSTADGRLLNTIRLPQGPGDVGSAFAVAISSDGTVIAAGGWTSPIDQPDQIYLFDATSGAMTDRIEGLPNVVDHLAFSPDSRRLSAVLFSGGLRLFDRENGWRELSRDEDYGERSYGAAFAEDGRLATTSYDGKLRLYDAEGRQIAVADVGGGLLYRIAFNPDGSRLAVEFDALPEIRLFDGRTLAPLPAPDTVGIDNGDLQTVAWAPDSGTLYAGGSYDDGTGVDPVVAWDQAGAGPRRTLPAGTDTIMSLRSLPGGDLLVAAADPWLGRLTPDGARRWSIGPQQMDPRSQRSSLGVSADGMVVDFGFKPRGARPARFDLATLKLTASPPDAGRTAPPVQGGLAVTDWEDSYTPALAGKPLPLEAYEISRSLAIHPDGKRFVLGTGWSLRVFDAEGTALWQRPVPGEVWAVNISGDGRLVVAAYGDGTIRWHRMEDGAEILALFPLIDEANWVAWTPEGVYAATTGARGVLRWHVNHGWDAAGEAIPVEAIPKTHRPEVIKLVLPQLGTLGALGAADMAEITIGGHAAASMAEIRNAVQVGTSTAEPPGARLHVLTVGVSDYGPKADWLQLEFADNDAHDLAEALVTAQGGLYARVLPQELLNTNATRGGILAGLGRMQANMTQGTGTDLAVVAFSGHGAMVGDMFYLLPNDVDAGDPVAIQSSALSVQDFQQAISSLAQHGRVIVLLDACHSGATTASGAALRTDANRLRELLRGPNIDVLTSSTAAETSAEDRQWQNGAFTEAVLEALTTRADGDQNGVLSTVEITDYLTRRVPELTVGKQTPGIDLRFESDVFVAGL